MPGGHSAGGRRLPGAGRHLAASSVCTSAAAAAAMMASTCARHRSSYVGFAAARLGDSASLADAAAQWVKVSGDSLAAAALFKYFRVVPESVFWGNCNLR